MLTSGNSHLSNIYIRKKNNYGGGWQINISFKNSPQAKIILSNHGYIPIQKVIQ